MKYLHYDIHSKSLSCNAVQSNDIILPPQTKTGFQNKTVIFGDGGRICVQSNFGYGRAAYLKCRIWCNNVPLLNLKNWMLTTHTQNNPLYFYAKPTLGGWNDLLDEICIAFNERDCWNFNSITTTIDQFNTGLQSLTSVELHVHNWDDRIIKKTGTQAILHFIVKLSMLMDAIKEVNLDNISIFNEHMFDFCCRILPYAGNAYNELKHQKSEFEEAFDKIYIYLKDNGRLDILINILKPF